MRGSLVSIAKRWTRNVRKTPPVAQALDVYMGRGFTEAKRVSATLHAPLYIVSAGLGIVSASDAIPPYDLTVADGPNSLGPLLTRLGKEPGDWWAALTESVGKHNAISALLEEHPGALALFALPGSYISLIMRDLVALTKAQLGRMYIITSEHGRSLIPEHVRPIAPPYDERLEGSTYAGTRTDFPQRGLRHFVEVLAGHQLPADAAARSVANAMSKLHKPAAPVRERRTDEEILTLLRSNWDRFDGSSGRLLRFLRDEVLVSCEQSRFRDLWNYRRQELTGKV